MTDNYDLELEYEEPQEEGRYDELDDELGDDISVKGPEDLGEADIEKRASCSSNTCSSNCTSSCGSPGLCGLSDGDLDISLD